jgi:hypothetical protein
VYLARYGVDFHMVTVIRRLPNGCEQPHPTTYNLNYNNISFHWDIFIKPYVWPNSNCARGREMKTKTKKSETGQAAIEPRTPSIPDKIWCQFSHGDDGPRILNHHSPLTEDFPSRLIWMLDFVSTWWMVIRDDNQGWTVTAIMTSNPVQINIPQTHLQGNI